MLVHTDPALRRRSSCRSLGICGSNIPGKGYDKINAVVRRRRRGWRAEQGRRDRPEPHRTARSTTCSTSTSRGSKVSSRRLGGVDMCITGENVNTPGYVEGEGESIYYEEPGYIADPLTGLHVKPGCQTLPADQALAYVRTRHLQVRRRRAGLLSDHAPTAVPPSRHQQAAATRPACAAAALQIKPIMENLRRDDDLKIADLAYLVGQLSGISTGRRPSSARCRARRPIIDGLAVIKMDPAREPDLPCGPRQGKQLGDTGIGVYHAASPRPRSPCWSSTMPPAARSPASQTIVVRLGVRHHAG